MTDGNQLEFLISRNFNGLHRLGSQIHHRAKFNQNQSSGFRDIAIYQFFKMAAGSHLGFLNFGNLNSQLPLEAKDASCC